MAEFGIAYALGPNLNRNLTDLTRLQKAQAAAKAALDCAASTGSAALSTTEQALVKAVGAWFPEERTLANGWQFDSDYADALDQAVLQCERGNHDNGNEDKHEPKYQSRTGSGSGSQYRGECDHPDLLVLAAQAKMTTSAWFYYDPATKEPFSWVPTARKRLERAINISHAAGVAHPLALHLRIHLIETLAFEPAVDTLNETADLLRDVIPDDAWGLGHLKHMPAHIYMLVDRLEDSTEQNIKASALDEGYFKLCSGRLG